MLFHVSLAHIILLPAPLVLAYTPLSSAPAELEIRNKISLYGIATDNRDLAQYAEIFMLDVVADYEGTISNGLPAFQAFELASIGNNVTQHAISTTVVEQSQAAKGKGAIESTAYVVVTYLGQGSLTGQVAQFYGKYLDQWMEGKDGWKIKKRTLRLFVSYPCGKVLYMLSDNEANTTVKATWLQWQPGHPVCCLNAPRSSSIL